jgi:PAS domain S-box-containing protein
MAGRVAQLGGWTIDLKTKVVHWSDEVCAIHDAPPGTTVTLAEGIEDYAPEWRSVIAEHVRACAEDGVPYDLELEKVSRTGRRVWVRTIGEPVRSADGRITHVQGAFQDITAQRRAKSLERDRKRRYRMLFEQSLDGILLSAPDGTILSANPSACRMLGYTEDEIRKLGREGIADPADPALAELIECRRRTGHAIGELTLIHRNGTRIPAEVSSQLFRDVDGEERTSLFIRDISERKRGEAALASAEAQYRHLFESAPYGIYALDIRGCFTRLNPEAERILGRSTEELIGQHFTSVAASSDLAKVQDAFDCVISGRTTGVEFDERIRHPSGSERLLRVTQSAIRDGNRIVGTHGIGRDITEEVEREKSLRRAERLASVGTLIGGVAHELNNPLHAIRNFADLMLMDARNGPDQEALEIIRREADRAARVVSDLRLIARSSQEERTERVGVDVNDVVRYVVKLRRYSLVTNNVTLVGDLAEDLPPVLADRAEIEQVVLNLVINAEQAMVGQHEGARQLILRTRRTPGGASIHVVDTGPGIAPHHLERIFDPFFTTKDPGEGTGLGLALVHNIVTEHQGQIHVESELGKGTAFRIDLPRAPAREQAIAGDEAVPPSRTLRILIVDDEPAIRLVSQRYLERLGHAVDAVADGESALRHIDRLDYDVIVSDLRMPGLDGRELLERLRRQGAGVEHRLIFLTGDAATAQAARVAAETGVHVLVKPLRLEELAQAVESLAKARNPM